MGDKVRRGITKTVSIAVASVIGVGVLGGSALFLTTSMPTIGIAAEKTIRGNVIYRERIALPPEANLIVQLADVSQADAAAIIIGETKISDIGSVPIPFSVNFEADNIKPGHSYALQARISAGDTLWFVNDTAFSVNPEQAQQPVDINVVMVRQNMDTTEETAIEGKEWLAEDILGGGVIDTAQTTLTIAQDGAVSGSGGCNRYFGKATFSEDALTFGAMGSTYMQCPPALMNQERKFLETLEKTHSYKLDMGKLVLLDGEGNEIMRLATNI